MCNLASSILEKYWDGRLPVRTDLIAQRLGIDVVEYSSPAESEGHSGEIFIDENDKATIKYNAQEAPVRQRFTIAHEIGHYALGHLGGSTRMFRDDPSKFSMDSTFEEVEANAFAASLLMPARIVKYLITEEGITSLAGLANKFGVSQIAMQYRLKKLRIIR